MSTPGFESSQNQTSAFATMIPTVTTGNVRVGHVVAEREHAA